ncbi:hypothetical protein [Sideroxydans sp. CL21]|nr:hypothetical protein [Sideroxydans sp. CL21]
MFSALPSIEASNLSKRNLTTKEVKPAGKPGSVVDSHSSRRFVT